MPWCEICKDEYESHVKQCPECGALLVDHLKEEKVPVQFITEEFTFLVNVTNMIEAEILISFLEGEGIPTLKKFESSGSYLNIASGFNFQGVDIYVPESTFEEARTIIKADLKLTQSDEIHGNQEFENLEKRYASKRKSIFRFIIIFVFIIPIIIAIFSNLKNLF